MKRIEVLDVWRSLAILLMMVYHFLYDLFMFGVVGRDVVFSLPALALRLGAVCSFMFISGAVVRYSRDSVRRGAVVFCCGMLVSIVMSFMNEPVQFGVLHNLGVMMIAYGLLSKKLPTPSGLWFPLLCAVIFAAGYYMSENVYVNTELLVPFGLVYPGFYSADYYPLFPWSMVFAAGVWFGGKLPRLRKRLPLLQMHFSPILSSAGRHSLIIYLTHQPVFYGVCWLIWGR